MQHSVKAPVNGLVFNRAVRDKMRTWVPRLEDCCQDEVSSSIARFPGRASSRLVCRMRPRDLWLIDKCRKQTCSWPSQPSR